MEPRPSKGSPIPWWGACLLTGLAILVLGGGMGLISAGGSLGLRERWLLGVAQLLSVGLATAAGLVLWPPGHPIGRALGFRPVSIRIMVLCIVAGCGLQFVLSECENLLRYLFPVSLAEQRRQLDFVRPDSLPELMAILFGLVLVAPFTEELLFRGLLLGGLRRRYAPWLAVGLSAALFGLIHVRPSAVGYATVAGFFFGWVAWRTRSIVSSIVMHASINLVPVVLSASALRISGFNTVSSTVRHVPLAILVPSGAVAAAALWWMVRACSDEKGGS